MDVKKEEIAEDFYQYFVREFVEGMDIPLHVLHLFTILLCSPDPVLVRVALRLLTDMPFVFDELETVIDAVLALRENHPEAEALIRKFRMMELDIDVDEGLENELEEEEEVVDDEEEDDDWLFEGDSGYDSESEEMTVERLTSVHEVFGALLAWSVSSGNSQQIAYTLEAFGSDQLPLAIYQKYNIAALVEQHAQHSEEALLLFDHIEFECQKEFDEMIYITRSLSVISVSYMDYLVRVLKTDGNFSRVFHVIEVLLEKSVPLELFQRHQVKEFLMQCLGITDQIMLLILKIREMEQGAGYF